MFIYLKKIQVSINKASLLILNFIKNYPVIFRTFLLLGMGLFSFYLNLSGKLSMFFTRLACIINASQEMHNILKESFQDTHFFILVLSLPIILLLWAFRTYDVNQNRKHNEASSFFNYLSLLTKDDSSSKQIAIKQLMHLRDKKLYPKKEIELAINQLKLDLQNTNLSGINLSGLDLTKANLINAILIDAKLMNTTLISVNLTGAKLESANLTNVNLTNANLTNAILTDTNLTNANLTNAGLIGAKLMNADLRGANLTGADLEDANLTDADVIGAKLRNADLINADLIKTTLRNAKLRNADLTGAKYNSKTKFPDGFDPKKYEMIEIV